MSKATRLLKLIDKLYTGQKFTVRHLAEEFEVSYRTMLRELQEVEEMGWVFHCTRRTEFTADIEC